MNITAFKNCSISLFSSFPQPLNNELLAFIEWNNGDCLNFKSIMQESRAYIKPRGAVHMISIFAKAHKYIICKPYTNIKFVTPDTIQ